MNQSINTDSKNSKEPQQKYRLGTVSIKILGGLNRFYRKYVLVPADKAANNVIVSEGFTILILLGKSLVALKPTNCRIRQMKSM